MINANETNTATPQASDTHAEAAIPTGYEGTSLPALNNALDAASYALTTPQQVAFAQYIRTHCDAEMERRAREHPLQFFIDHGAGQSMLQRASLVFIKSQPGQGKTQACSLLAAAVLNGMPDFKLNTCFTNALVLYIDTEMNEPMTLRFKERVASMVGAEAACRLHVLNQTDNMLGDRIAQPYEMWQMAKQWVQMVAMNHPDAPILLVVDGIAQYMNDVNDPQESGRLTKEMMAFCGSQNMTILSVLHENDGQKQGQKMRGHLGSDARRFAREVYAVKHSGTIFTLYNDGDAGTKHSMGPGIDPVSWTFDGKRLYPIATPPPATRTRKKDAAPAEEPQPKAKKERPVTPHEIEQGQKIFDTDHTVLTREQFNERFRTLYPNLADTASKETFNRFRRKGLITVYTVYRTEHWRLASPYDKPNAIDEVCSANLFANERRTATTTGDHVTTATATSGDDSVTTCNATDYNAATSGDKAATKVTTSVMC